MSLIIYPKAGNAKIELLKKAYAAAEEDPDTKEVVADWSILDGEDWTHDQ